MPQSYEKITQPLKIFVSSCIKSDFKIFTLQWPFFKQSVKFSYPSAKEMELSSLVAIPSWLWAATNQPFSHSSLFLFVLFQARICIIWTMDNHNYCCTSLAKSSIHRRLKYTNRCKILFPLPFSGRARNSKKMFSCQRDSTTFIYMQKNHFFPLYIV